MLKLTKSLFFLHSNATDVRFLRKFAVVPDFRKDYGIGINYYPRRKKMGDKGKTGTDSSLIAAGSSSRISVNIIQNGSFGFYRAVYLATDHVVYLFNCPDSNRRLFSEHGLRRIPQVQHVFFTHGAWHNVSGIASLTAFLKEVKRKELPIYGPPGLSTLVNYARKFNEQSAKLIIDDPPILEEHGLSVCEDSTVRIESVPFTNSPEKDKAIEEYLAKKNEDSDSPYPLRMGDLAVAYICTLKPKWGKILLNKCLELGIPVGPKIGRLQRGLVVQNKDGRDVHPDEVREPPLPPQFFSVVECPREDFVDSLARSEAFSKFYAGQQEQLQVLIHFSPSHVMETDGYRRWMDRFPSSTIHWICNDASPATCHLNGAYRAQKRVNAVHPEIFPLLWHHRMPPSSEEWKSSFLENVPNKVMGEAFTKYCLRPTTEFQPITINDILLNPDDYIPKTGVPETVELDKFRKEVASLKLSGEVYPRVTFLGTSAAVPTKYRNVSSILLDLDERRSLMFDCGESTVSQMKLFYGDDNYDQRMVALKAVFISHLHMDHYFGLYQLINDRKLSFEKLGVPYENLIVLAATPLARGQQAFSSFAEDTPGLCKFYSTAGNEQKKSAQAVAEQLDLQRVDIVKVIHPQCSTGYVVTTKDGKKIVYSGDTRPCEDLIKCGMDADLLIHEATMNNGFEKDAITKKHCTKSEAIAVSSAMKAKWTILTHFTGQNSKMPYLEETIVKENPTVGMSLDFMTVRWEHLELIPKLIPVLFELYNVNLTLQEWKRLRKQAIAEADADEDDEVNTSEQPKKARVE